MQTYNNTCRVFLKGELVMKRLLGFLLFSVMGVIILGIIPANTQSLITPDDFELIIFVEETTIIQGENFIVDVEMKNKSGEDLVIHYDYLFLSDS